MTTDFHTLVQQGNQALAPHYGPAAAPVLEAAGMQGADWYVSNVARSRYPEPVTAAYLHSFFPYFTLANREKGLAEAAGRGFLETAGDGAYRLTASGRAGVEGFFEAARQAIARLDPLPPAELERLAGLLQRVRAAVESAPEPAGKRHLHYSRSVDPGLDAPAAVRIDQYLTDLGLYRDDSHLAAWQPHGISGQAWEAFTFVWRDEANTLAALAEQLSFREHTADSYAAALQELAARGWVEEVDGRYQITEAGRLLREAVEETTRHYYDAPWQALSTAEQAELADLLARFNNRLQEMTADQVAAARIDLWPLANQLSQSIGAVTRQTVVPAIEAAGIAQPGLPFCLLYAYFLAPEPFSPAMMARRFPYGRIERWNGYVETLAEKGLLASTGNGAYTLTENGRAIEDGLNRSFYRRLAEVEEVVASSFPAADLERLAALLKRVIEACFQAQEPPGTWCLQRFTYQPPLEVSTLGTIDMSLDSLNAFRDDAHLAAWQPYGLAAHAWEFFTLLWQGEVKSAAEMAERRDQEEALYARVLDELAQQGWIESPGNGTYQLSRAGRQFREQAESLTNRYFYGPWATLDGDETAELRALLTRLATSLKEVSI
ncbi:MAG: hypothetical protein L0332_14450 [Chloroflexi bacterium]|nr:hypothetical protein [Chloroflexota bacterium]MCI0575546.1 hypothetical protein [Chloroflexota bacterium]MCI0644086.1 hypothetical protein [Chloroflexota bacterium]MCI0727902.1 hypothetical protein [Chloroflexota bacterium]